MLKNVKYIKTTHTYEELPQDKLPEVVIVGRSNVGKSSFINAVTGQKKLAYVGKKPGKTRALSIFDVDGRWRMVDVPGYGFAKVSMNQKVMFADMIDKYFEVREELQAVVVLIDSRRGVTLDDQEIINFLIETKRRFVVIGTKLDKINQSQQHKFKVEVRNTLQMEPVIYSALTGKNLPKVIELLEGLMEY